NLLSCGEWRPFCRQAKTARYHNHGDAAPVVLLSGRENRSAQLRRDRVSVGNFSGTVCFCRPQREREGLKQSGCGVESFMMQRALPCIVMSRGPRYRTFVSEDAGPNTLVATVLAKDPDGDGITYSITAGNEEGNFVIDSQKGLIRLRSTPLPKLQGLEYILNVTATDDNASGGPHPLTSTARVVVGVDDVNNNKPIFEQ
ncbi:hypothetical protein CHARACLAT_027036, partial [Characodon lateralis]|nr:hypothetical protein [Characodon lateralis]